MAARGERIRLDEWLVRHGRAPSREQAKALVLAGKVHLSGSIQPKPGVRVADEALITIDEGPPYVSRGGTKLAHALDRFQLDVHARICADLGASTGGFTDCLLQRGASRVYAVDVAYGQLDWGLRQDARVVVLERTNARYLESLAEPVDLVTVDVSFISLKLVLPAARRIALPAGEIVALVKPQFEAGKDQVGRGGVVRPPEIHQSVLGSLARWLSLEGFALRDVTASPLKGPAGNIEFLVRVALSPGSSPEAADLIAGALGEAQQLRDR